MSAPIQSYTSTFGAVGFRITDNQMALPEPGTTLRVQKDPIPYGNLSTVQIGGYDSDDLTLSIVLNTSDFAALRAAAQAATTATLTILGDIARTALLTKLGQPRKYAEGETIVQVTFMFDS